MLSRHQPTAVLLSVAISEWLSDIKLTKKPKTHLAYAKGLEYFAESGHKHYLENVDRRDLLAFAAYLRDEKELAPQTCDNRTLCRARAGLVEQR
jgi:hypothetical protein